MVAMPLGSNDQATVPVLAADQTPLGWGRWVREGPRRGSHRDTLRSFELYDAASRPLVVARCEEQVRRDVDRSGTHTFTTFTLSDPLGYPLADGSRLNRGFGSASIRLTLGGHEVLMLRFGRRARHQVAPTTLSINGHPVGQVTQLGHRSTGAPGEAWLRLDRAPAPAGPAALALLAAPLLLMTWIT